MKILFKYPSRQRPDRFFEGVDNITQLIVDKENYEISCTLDLDDATMNNASIIQRIHSYPKISISWGHSKSKIDAINRNVPESGWDIICVMSDDMRWRTRGFDEIIRNHMPENLDALLHFPDDYAKDRVCTCPIIGYRYYLRDMYIYWPGYYSMWSDDEQTAVAKVRDCYIYVPDVIEIEHLHYTNNAKAKKDELYWRNDTYNADKVIFEQRKARGFDL